MPSKEIDVTKKTSQLHGKAATVRLCPKGDLYIAVDKKFITTHAVLLQKQFAFATVRMHI